MLTISKKFDPIVGEEVYLLEVTTDGKTYYLQGYGFTSLEEIWPYYEAAIQGTLPTTSVDVHWPFEDTAGIL